jgi:hypothetical protein
VKAPRPIALLLLIVLAACGPTAREKAISATFVSINAARDGFVSYNTAHENDIVTHAATKVEAVNNLTKYRLAREHVTEAFIAAYHALSAAVLVASDPKSLPALLQAAADLKVAIAALEKE